MRLINITMLCFIVVVGLNNNLLSELVLRHISMFFISILFGLLTLMLINDIFKSKLLSGGLLFLILINVVVVIVFPETTGYILPSKEDSLIWINLLYPFFYLVHRLVKKNNKK